MITWVQHNNNKADKSCQKIIDNFNQRVIVLNLHVMSSCYFHQLPTLDDSSI